MWERGLARLLGGILVSLPLLRPLVVWVVLRLKWLGLLLPLQDVYHCPPEVG
jgi:hypothetical protein